MGAKNNFGGFFMKKMKFTWLLTLLVALTLVFFACGSDPDDGKKPTGNTTSDDDWPRFEDTIFLGQMQYYDNADQGKPDWGIAKRWVFMDAGNNEIDEPHAKLNDFFEAKYFIIATIGGGDVGGFNQLDVGIQGNSTTSANAWKLNEGNLLKSDEYGDFTHNDDEIIYLVFDITKFPSYNTMKSDFDENKCSQMQFVINYGHEELGDFVAYVTTKSLTKPSDAADVKAGKTEKVSSGLTLADVKAMTLYYITRDTGLTKESE